jgi:hypothetical protein
MRHGRMVERFALGAVAATLLVPAGASAATVSATVPYAFTAASGERNALTITFDEAAGMTFADRVPVTVQAAESQDPEFPVAQPCVAISATSVHCTAPPRVHIEGDPTLPLEPQNPLVLLVTLGDGDDALSFAGPVPPGDSVKAKGGAGNDTVAGMDNTPAPGDRVQTQNGVGDTIAGGDGNDVVRGLGGADDLNGDDIDARKPGDDVVDGGLGPDQLDPGLDRVQETLKTKDVLLARDGFKDQVGVCNRGITPRLKIVADPLDYPPFLLDGPFGSLDRLKFCARGSSVADAGAARVPAVNFTITCPASASGGCRGDLLPPVEFGESTGNSGRGAFDLGPGASRTFTRKVGSYPELNTYLRHHHSRATVTALATTRDGAGHSHTVRTKLAIRP